MPHTIEMQEYMTLAETQEAFATAAILEGFHARFQICAFPDLYIQSVKHPNTHFITMEYGDDELTYNEDDEWSPANPSDMLYSGLSISYPFNPTNNTCTEPGRIIQTWRSLRTRDIADKFGIITDPDNHSIISNLFGIIFLDHGIILPITATSTITLTDFDDGGLDYIVAIDQRILERSFLFRYQFESLAEFVAHPRGQQIVDLSMHDVILDLPSAPAQNEDQIGKFPSFNMSDGLGDPAQLQNPQPRPTPPQYCVDPCDPNPVYLFDDLQSQRSNKILKQNCSYFSRMVRAVKPSAKDLVRARRGLDFLDYSHLSSIYAWRHYQFIHDNEIKFIANFTDEYPSLVGDFDLLGRHDWPEPDASHFVRSIDGQSPEWIGLHIFGLTPLAALIQQLPKDHPIRRTVGREIIRFEKTTVYMTGINSTRL